MRRLVLTVGCLIVAGYTLAAPVPKAAKKKADLLPLTAGNKWEYVSPDAPDQVVDTREVLSVEEKDGSRLVTQKLAGNVQTYRVDAAGVAVIRTGDTDYATPRVILKPDIKDGDTWEWDAGGYTEVRTVGKAEKVKVPAGEFEAIPIQSRYVQNGTSFQATTVWYTAGVGLVRIDRDGQPSQVLKAFIPGDGKGAKK